MESRPYRSHKVRACDLCRRHKTGCVVDVPGLACRRCRSRHVRCLYATNTANDPSSRRAGHPEIASVLPSHSPDQDVLRRDASAAQISPDQASNVRSTGPLSKDASHSAAVHILGPSGAQDSHAIEQHLVPGSASPVGKEQIGIYSSDRRKPVGFTSLLNNQDFDVDDPFSVRVKRREILEQILGPFRDTLIKLFYEKVNTAFPIIHKTIFPAAMASASEHCNLPSDALLCAAYASALVYWNCVGTLSSCPVPNYAMVNGLVSGALQEDFSGPQLSTVAASLVFLNKRPVVSVISNSMNLARTVSLAHCLGLNRDSTLWSIPDSEKHLRTGLWWGLLIHDTWSSLARGIPPLIIPSQYDVPVPTVDALCGAAKQNDIRNVTAAECFIWLCKFTTITQKVLRIAFDLRSSTTDAVMKGLRQCQVELDTWEDTFMHWKIQCSSRTEIRVPGASNLWLCFLTIKMLLCRIALHESVKSEETQPEVTRRFNQMNCTAAAHDIVDFVRQLDEHDFADFWLPYTASHFTVCATLLLRCALEADEPQVTTACMDDLEILQKSLKFALEHYGWELGEACIARCEALIPRIRRGNKDSHELPSDNDIQGMFPDFATDMNQGDMALFDVDFWLSTAPMDGTFGDDPIS